jgi:hypothetical protein
MNYDLTTAQPQQFQTGAQQSLSHPQYLRQPQQLPSPDSGGVVDRQHQYNNSSEVTVLSDGGPHHRGGQLRGLPSAASEQQQQLANSLFDWDINDPDIPAKVHLYVSTHMYSLYILSLYSSYSKSFLSTTLLCRLLEVS